MNPLNKIELNNNKNGNSKINYYPIVYRDDYDIRVGFFSKLHPFDTYKWSKIADSISKSLDCKIRYVDPKEPVSDEQLRLVHSKQFLQSLQSKKNLVLTSEVCMLYFLPLSYINRILIRPLRYQTNGTILASKLAMKYQTSINIGGGFHHCSANQSGGFCFFADITLAIRNVWNADSESKSKILIVDCDAHQGNGYAHDILKMPPNEKKLVYIMDMFNPNIYPKDEIAKLAINREIHIGRRMNDNDYLKLLEYHLDATVNADKFKPDLIIYNAGTDILKGDMLGKLSITEKGILQRDQLVFQFRKKINSSLLMLLSGGYQQNNAKVIAESILNLIELKLLKRFNEFQI